MEDKNNPSNTLHNIPKKGVNSTLETSAATKDLTKPIHVQFHDEKGRFTPANLANPLGKGANYTDLLHLIRLKGDKPCAYVPGMTWAQAIVENEWSQALTDPIARKHLLDRLLGRATESIDMRQSGEVRVVVEYEPYVKHIETKQLESNLTITNPENNSAPPDTKEV